jgi:hypothetical protein
VLTLLGLFIILENVAIDLETFSNHAGRTTVTTDDVLLLARKNPDLHEIMKEYVDERKALSAAAGKSKGKGKAKAKK